MSKREGEMSDQGSHYILGWILREEKTAEFIYNLYLEKGKYIKAIEFDLHVQRLKKRLRVEC
jgi:hypothetical protein